MKFRPVYLFFSLIYLIGFCFFYYKYVPLVKSFQLFLVPILFFILVSTSLKIEWGIYFFIFAFPLINNLPYFFGIYEHIPLAPTALVLFLVFFLGWLFNNSLSDSKLKFFHPIFRPLILLALIISVSGIITFLRYSNFFPFLSDGVYEFIVNDNGVRAGGALMSNVFTFLNYLTGFLFFALLINLIKSHIFRKRLLIVLSISMFISLLFAFFQKYYSLSLGNTPFWVQLHQINSTFKDPNSFGAYLSAMLLLLLGIAFSLRTRFKVFYLILVISGLLIFPSIGSRSSFLSFIISIIVFFLLILINNKSFRLKKNIYLISFLVFVVLIVFSVLIFSKTSILYKRLSSDLSLFSNNISFNALFTGKIELWRIASQMIKDYPLTGVGTGSFIVELPNYGNLMGLSLFKNYTDSAENYFFQIGSELGVIGLIAVFWLFLEVFRQIIKSWKIFAADRETFFIFVGTLSGISSLFINYCFHSYIGSFETTYIFWLLVAFIFSPIAFSANTTVNPPFSRKFKIMALILITIFGAAHLWNSYHSLSLWAQTKEFGWNQNFGLYEWEIDKNGFSFQWTKKSAGLTIDNIGPILVIPITASHPDIATNPVKVKVFSTTRKFKKKKMIQEIILKEKNWVNFEYPVSDLPAKKLFLIFETNRTWQPLKYLKVPDPRSLAIGLGKEWFLYPSEIPKEKIKAVEKLSFINLQGESNKNPISIDKSQISFKVGQEKIALQLWVKGQKAFSIGPYIIIRLDNQIIGKTMLTEETWTPLIFTPKIGEGEHVLSVEFVNDIFVPSLGQDRNVFLGDLDIIYLR